MCWACYVSFPPQPRFFSSSCSLFYIFASSSLSLSRRNSQCHGRFYGSYYRSYNSTLCHGLSFAIFCPFRNNHWSYETAAMSKAASFATDPKCHLSNPCHLTLAGSTSVWELTTASEPSRRSDPVRKWWPVSPIKKGHKNVGVASCGDRPCGPTVSRDVGLPGSPLRLLRPKHRSVYPRGPGCCDKGCFWNHGSARTRLLSQGMLLESR